MRIIILIIFIAAISATAAPPEYIHPWPDGIKAKTYRQRRGKIARVLGGNSALMALSADYYSGCVARDDFRQDANVIYLSGCTEPGAILLIMPSGFKIGGEKVESALFLKEQDEGDARWHGLRMRPSDAEEILKIDAVNIRNLRDNLSIFEKIDTLYIPFPSEEGLHAYNTGDSEMPEIVGQIKKAAGDIDIIKNLSELNDMRGIKDSAEVRLLRRAALITARGHIAAMKAMRPGMTEKMIEAEMEYQFRANGADGPAFGSIIGSGPNSCVLHYMSNVRKTRPGELVLMDCGASYCGYAGDITRTVPVSGKFSDEQRIIYDLVLRAHEKAAEAAEPGNMFMAPHMAAMNIISKGLTELGITTSAAGYRKYFSHGVSHYLGLNVHDPGSFGNLRPGNVITIEPGIYIPADSDCDRKWWNIGIRIEDDYLITEDGAVSLTPELPKDPGEIEKIMSDK